MTVSRLICSRLFKDAASLGKMNWCRGGPIGMQLAEARWDGANGRTELTLYNESVRCSVVLPETWSQHRVCSYFTLTRPDPAIITDPVTRDPVPALPWRGTKCAKSAIWGPMSYRTKTDYVILNWLSSSTTGSLFANIFNELIAILSIHNYLNYCFYSRVFNFGLQLC